MKISMFSTHEMKYITDIYFFEVNTKYISSSVLKTSEFSRVRSTNENFDVFNLRDEIKKSKFSFYFILFRRFTVNQFVNHASRKPNHNNVKEDKGVFVTKNLDQSTWSIVIRTYR